MYLTNKLEKLGWLKLPTAKKNYLINTHLQEDFNTYRDYSSYLYNNVKKTWDRTSSSSNYENTKKKFSNKKTFYLKTEEEKIIDKEIQLLTNEKNKNQTLVNSNKTNITNKVDIKKIKTPRNKKNFRYKTHTNCPNCMSKLKSNEFNILECTGDRLLFWHNEFLLYMKLDKEKQNKYLLCLSNINLFLDLFDKWNYLDDNGIRVNFQCEYSNKIMNPVTRFRTTLPDPILVKRIERSLGRPLTEEEKHGEKEIWKEGNTFFTNYRKGRKIIKIPQIIFPNGLL